MAIRRSQALRGAQFRLRTDSRVQASGRHLFLVEKEGTIIVLMNYSAALEAAAALPQDDRAAFLVQHTIFILPRSGSSVAAHHDYIVVNSVSGDFTTTSNLIIIDLSNMPDLSDLDISAQVTISGHVICRPNPSGWHVRDIKLDDRAIYEYLRSDDDDDSEEVQTSAIRITSFEQSL